MLKTPDKIDARTMRFAAACADAAAVDARKGGNAGSATALELLARGLRIRATRIGGPAPKNESFTGEAPAKAAKQVKAAKATKVGKGKKAKASAKPVKAVKAGKKAKTSADAPYGYKADGTPKQKPGRKSPATAKAATKAAKKAKVSKTQVQAKTKKVKVSAKTSDAAPYGYKADGTPKKKPGRPVSAKVASVPVKIVVKDEAKTSQEGSPAEFWAEPDPAVSDSPVEASQTTAPDMSAVEAIQDVETNSVHESV